MKATKKFIIAVFIVLSAIFIVPNVIPGMMESHTVEASSTKINITKKTLNIGESCKLKITGTKKKIKWSTSNKQVATVNSDGKVKAKKKGTAIITAKVGKKSYKCKITVTNEKIRKAYKDYIDNYKYSKYMSVQAETYTIFDINQDGIDELLVKTFSFDDFYYTGIFTYDTSKNKVKYVKEIYSYGEISYSKKYNCLIYAEVRPSFFDGGYIFCKLENKKIVKMWQLTYDKYSGEKYYLYRPKKKTKLIKKSQYNEYFKKQKYFNYKYLDLG